MRLAALLATALLIQGCAATRIDTDNVKPLPLKSGKLPVDASLMVYMPRSSSERKLHVYYGYDKEILHEYGKDFQEVALGISEKYFSEVKPMDLTASTEFVLKFEGRGDYDNAFGSYITKITGTLFDRSGEVVYRADSRGSVTTGAINDKNAFFNSYVKAVTAFYDQMMRTKVTEIRAYAAANTPGKFHLKTDAGDDEQYPNVKMSGSGFYVNHAGQVVTNHHVVNDCLALSVALDGEEVDAAPVYMNEENDIAILDTGLTDTAAVQIKPGSPVRLGETVLAVGYPLHGVLSASPSLTIGNVSALQGLKGDSHSIQISSPVQPGNSGGPLLNEYGALVGVVQSKLNALGLAMLTGDIAQNVNFAINNDTLVASLDNAGIQYNYASDTRERLHTPDIADQATAYTVQVLCRQ